VRQSVEAMGGRVTVASALGAGAAFTVTLPLAKPPAP
jgi:signal transduction histidine kinase